MANEAYVAEKVAEVAKSPKAMLLGAIGAMSSTPTNSANVAEELGLSKEEIQGARWVALFKKDKTDLEFLKELLEILEKPEKEEKMKIQKCSRVVLLADPGVLLCGQTLLDIEGELLPFAIGDSFRAYPKEFFSNFLEEVSVMTKSPYRVKEIENVLFYHEKSETMEIVRRIYIGKD